MMSLYTQVGLVGLYITATKPEYKYHAMVILILISVHNANKK